MKIINKGQKIIVKNAYKTLNNKFKKDLNNIINKLYKINKTNKLNKNKINN